MFQYLLYFLSNWLRILNARSDRFCIYKLFFKRDQIISVKTQFYIMTLRVSRIVPLSLLAFERVFGVSNVILQTDNQVSRILIT